MCLHPVVLVSEVNNLFLFVCATAHTGVRGRGSLALGLGYLEVGEIAWAEGVGARGESQGDCSARAAADVVNIVQSDR